MRTIFKIISNIFWIIFAFIAIWMGLLFMSNFITVIIMVVIIYYVLNRIIGLFKKNDVS